MGKKKLSLKPVQRGYGTTSVPTKKAKAEAEAAASAAASEPEADTAPVPQAEIVAQPAADRPPQTLNSQGPKAALPLLEDGQADSWDNDQTLEQAVLQGLVDRLQERSDKEVSRVLKAIEFDARFAASFPRLTMDERTRSEILSYAIQDYEEASGQQTRGLPPDPSQPYGDKTLSRVYVAYQVLLRSGFPSDRVKQYILEGMVQGQGWQEGFEWMWLHMSEDESRQVGKGSVQAETVSIDGSEPPLDAPLLDVAAEEAPPTISPPPASEPTIIPVQDSTSVEAAVTTSLFQSQGGSESDPDSDSEAELDINKENQDWAQLMLELDSLRIATGTGKAKGKKGKANAVVMETPEMVKLKNKIAKVEKQYMFSRKDADVILKALKSKRDMQVLETKLKGLPNSERSSPAPPSTVDASQVATPSHAASEPAEPSGEFDGDSDDGGIFGNMLEQPEEGTAPLPSTNTTIIVRDMPIPKQFSFSGNTPKALLRLALSKSAKHAAISFARLSGNARVARSGVEIRWSPLKRRAWRMENIACGSFEEAENYISTLALHELCQTGLLSGVNWRTMPPAYRELWDELEAAYQQKIDAENRETWKVVKDLVDQKVHAFNNASAVEGASKPAAATPSENTNVIIPQAPVYSQELQSQFEKRISSPSYRRMRQDRDTLPIAPFRDDIIKTTENSQVLVFSGETGCGKSTQLPAFILEHSLAQGKPCKILVTEPRRISAISLAQRVSAELGDSPGAMGSSASLVGYSIRLESKSSANTRLLFVTNGIALRMLEGGSGSGGKSTAFDEVTHIIVDEVHERSIESDFLLIVLKELLLVRTDLKVILMSATVDAERLSAFFGGCPFMSVPGRTFPVTVRYLEDAVEQTGWHIDESSPYAVWTRNKKPGSKQLEWTEDTPAATDSSDDEGKPSDPAKLSSQRYSPRTVETVNLLDSRQIPYDLIIRLLEQICFDDPSLQQFSPATLVFMPGLAEIRKLNDALQSHPKFGASSDFVIYPLHSTISSEGQSAVFQIPPQGVRKIVISTNIAETGVTIPDITCVIDTGKQREMRYDEKRQLSRLVESYIARSNAKQRRGRAGRVQEGLAFHLLTKARHDSQLAEHPVPEMLRLSLQDLALRIKILKIKIGTSIEDVLVKALDPPSSTNIQRAVSALVEVKALTVNEEITSMGRLLSKLPMDVHLGKFLLVAALFKCLDPALTIAATLNSKSPFVTPFGFEGQAETAKKSFAVGNSDFLTIANVFDSWRRASENANFVRTFCKRNFVSHQNLQQIEELRQQLLAYLIDSSFIAATPAQKEEIAKARYSRSARTRFVTVPHELNSNGRDYNLLEAALAAGLYPKILSLEPSGGLRTITNQQTVAIHPSSINFRVPKSEFGASFLTYFTLMQSKKLYAWEVGPVQDLWLALLCGDLADFKVMASSLQIDRRVRFQADPKTLIAIKRMREQLASALAIRLKGRVLSPRQSEWFELGLSCLALISLAPETKVVVG